MAKASGEEESMTKASGDEESQCLWSDLPSELLSLIRSYLFTERDYYIFDLICKSWKHTPNLRRQLPLLIDYSRLQSPLLMSSNRGRYNFFHPLHHTYHMHIPELLNKRILYSRHGWLLIMGGLFYGNKQMFFFNPFTKVIIDLPNLPPSSTIIKFSFSGLPTSEDCVVVGIDNSLYLMTIVVIKPGEESWKVDEFDFRHIDKYSVKTFRVSSNPVFANGYCYCLDVDGKVGVFDPRDTTNSWEFCGMRLSRQHRGSLIQSFMLESDGELIAIFLSNDGRVSVYNLHASKMDWIKVEDLGDKVIYLSNGASWAERGVSRNRIYLPMLYNNKAIVFYNLTTARYHSNGYDFSGTSFYHMKQLLFHSTWIKPENI